MKRDNVNYLLVGSFVLLMGAILLYALYRITGHSAKGDTYFTHFPNHRHDQDTRYSES